MTAELVVDIGPKDCLFVVGKNHWTMDYGFEQVVKDHILSDPPKPEELSAALSVVELYIDDFKRTELYEEVGLTEAVTFSGQAFELAAVEAGDGRTAEQMSGYKMSAESLEEVFRCLVTENSDNRKHNPGLSPDMVDSILGVSVLVVEIARQLEITDLAIDTPTEVIKLREVA